jgi:hypothetical protein
MFWSHFIAIRVTVERDKWDDLLNFVGNYEIRNDEDHFSPLIDYHEDKESISKKVFEKQQKYLLC